MYCSWLVHTVNKRDLIVTSYTKAKQLKTLYLKKMAFHCENASFRITG